MKYCDFVSSENDMVCRCCERRVRSRVLPIWAACPSPCKRNRNRDETQIRDKFVKEAKSLSAGARPGAKLKSLLKSWLGVSASPNCSCNARARAMDDNEAREPGWCEKNIDEIVGWLEEEARKRRLPFVRYAAKLLVRRAIRLAYKEAKT